MWGSQCSYVAPYESPRPPTSVVRHTESAVAPDGLTPFRHSVAGMTTPPAIEAHDVVKVFGEGGAQVRALDGVDLVGRARRDGRDHGPVRLRQEHAASHRRRARDADRRHHRRRRPPLRRRRRQRAHAAAPRPHRLRVPVLQPARVAERRGERVAARPDRPPHGRGDSPARRRAAPARRPRGPRVAHAGGAVGRPAAAGVDRPCAAARAGAGARRRADRQPRHAQRPRGPATSSASSVAPRAARS